MGYYTIDPTIKGKFINIYLDLYEVKVSLEKIYTIQTQ